MEIEEEVKRFLIAEYQDRRAQILSIIKQIDDGQKYCLASTAAFWAWVAAKEPQPALNYITWIPALIVLYFLIKWRKK